MLVHELSLLLTLLSTRLRPPAADGESQRGLPSAQVGFFDAEGDTRNITGVEVHWSPDGEADFVELLYQ
jgi:hypothetical protein